MSLAMTLATYTLPFGFGCRQLRRDDTRKVMRQPRRAHRLSGAIVVAVLLASGNKSVELFTQPASPQRGDVSPIQRQTTFGVVVGTDLSDANGAYVWKGIPYARSPVGE